jgi:hypothetical protein
MQVEKTRKFDRQRPEIIARKFKIPIDSIIDLKNGGIVDLDDTRARTLKQWGMVKYASTENVSRETSDSEQNDDVSMDKKKRKKKGGK